MERTVGSAAAVFTSRIHDINAISNTPEIIRTHALGALKAAQSRKMMGDPIANAIRALENIKKDSLEESYRSIYNSTNILAVSALSDCFRNLFIEMAYRHGFSGDDSLNFKKISLTVSDLIDVSSGNINLGLAQLFIARDSDISFDDLQSVVKTFKSYFNFDIPLTDQEKKSIIFYTQCRHVLAHLGGKVDEKFVRRVSSQNANLKQYSNGSVVELDERDWAKMSKAFKSVVDKINEALLLND